MRTSIDQVIASVTATVKGNLSLPCLLEQYEVLKTCRVDNRRAIKLRAEICYLLAMNMVGIDPTQAIEFAEESVRLYKSLNIQTIEDATPILHTLLPDLMHEGVVEGRLLSSKVNPTLVPLPARIGKP